MKIIFGTIVLFLIGLTSNAFAGGTVGNGADLTDIQDGSAWYLGPKSIRTCIVTHKDFGVSKQQARESLEKAFKTWETYLSTKLVNSVASGEDQYLRGAYGDPKFLIYMHHQMMADCDGSEDLKVYFGVQDSQVRKELRKLQKPIGVAVRKNYDSKMGWGKGFIWISSSSPSGHGANWGTPFLLQGVLTHELGHVAGIGHVSNTIMDEEIADFLTKTSYEAEYNEELFSQIDHRKELYVCTVCSFSLEGDESYSEMLKTGVEELLERPSVGVVRSTAIRIANSNNIELTLQDDVGQVKLIIEPKVEVARSIDSSELFKRYLSSDVGAEGTAILNTLGLSHSGFIRLHSGKELEVLINRNIAIPLEIKLIEGQQSHPLFISEYVDFE